MVAAKSLNSRTKPTLLVWILNENDHLLLLVAVNKTPFQSSFLNIPYSRPYVWALQLLSRSGIGDKKGSQSMYSLYSE